MYPILLIVILPNSILFFLHSRDILPFGIGAVLTQPTEITFLSSVFFISFFNFFIHMSKLKNLNWLYFLVSPKEHLEHHEKKTRYYSTPFLFFDKIFS